MAKKKAKATKPKVYTVRYFDKDEVEIDQTQIDSKDDELAWQLFDEFGHTREEGTYLEYEEVDED